MTVENEVSCWNHSDTSLHSARFLAHLHFLFLLSSPTWFRSILMVHRRCWTLSVNQLWSLRVRSTAVQSRNLQRANRWFNPFPGISSIISLHNLRVFDTSSSISTKNTFSTVPGRLPRRRTKRRSRWSTLGKIEQWSMVAVQSGAVHPCSHTKQASRFNRRRVFNISFPLSSPISFKCALHLRMTLNFAPVNTSTFRRSSIGVKRILTHRSNRANRWKPRAISHCHLFWSTNHWKRRAHHRFPLVKQSIVPVSTVHQSLMNWLLNVTLRISRRPRKSSPMTFLSSKRHKVETQTIPDTSKVNPSFDDSGIQAHLQTVSPSLSAASSDNQLAAQPYRSLRSGFYSKVKRTTFESFCSDSHSIHRRQSLPSHRWSWSECQEHAFNDAGTQCGFRHPCRWTSATGRLRFLQSLLLINIHLHHSSLYGIVATRPISVFKSISKVHRRTAKMYPRLHNVVHWTE